MLPHRTTKRNQSGFCAIEVLLVVLIIAVLAMIGLVVFQRHKLIIAKNSAATSPMQTTTQPQSNTTTDSNAWAQVTPTTFVSSLLGTLSKGDEAHLEQLLTPAFKNFRLQSLAAGHCNNPAAQSLTCDSLLDASTIHSLTSLNPAVVNFTSKDVQKGKGVTYHLTRGGSDPGTTYFTFYLLSHDNSWLLNDYKDVFVSQGVVYSPLPGEMEQRQ